ncbi:MAG: PCRF domain-containing protein, partial [Clostridia bacterium]
MKISDGMLLKLDKIKVRYHELSDMLTKADIVSNQEQLKKLGKERSDLEPIVELFEVYLAHKAEYLSCSEMYESETDQEIKDMVKDELDELREALDEDGNNLKISLLPKDSDDENNVIVEIRAGVGGEEAALFGVEIMRMYRHYADLKRWKIDEVNMNYTELGGAKELVFMISGKGAYGALKFESGVHRVQRVPETESQGRVHTSTITVAVLPEAPDVEVNLNESDVKVDTYRSSGAGGQHVNKTESAIRMTHLPT